MPVQWLLDQAAYFLLVRAWERDFRTTFSWPLTSLIV